MKLISTNKTKKRIGLALVLLLAAVCAKAESRTISFAEAKYSTDTAAGSTLQTGNTSWTVIWGYDGDANPSCSETGFTFTMTANNSLTLTSGFDISNYVKTITVNTNQPEGVGLTASAGATGTDQQQFEFEHLGDGVYQYGLTSLDGATQLSRTPITFTFSDVDQNNGDVTLTLTSIVIETVDALTSYPLTVDGTQVTELNKDNVLNTEDPTVTYNSRTNTLVLNGANITQGIRYTGYSEGGLNIYLKGSNTVSSENIFTYMAPAIECSSNDATPKLTITTDGSTPGTLTLKTATNSTQKVITGFDSVTLGAGLSWLTGSADATEATIGTVIKPIVETEQETVVVTVADTESAFIETVDDQEQEVDLSNTVIANVLYTLNQENKAVDDQVTEDDGYDKQTGAIVLNTTMSDSQVEAVVNSDKEPGTSEFADAFTGIVFKIAAGAGLVYVDYRTGESGVIAVKIGNGQPTLLTSVERTTTEIAYGCEEPTYVYIYNASTSSPSRKGHRIKKTSTSGEYFGAGSKSLSIAASPDSEELLQAEETPADTPLQVYAADLVDGKVSISDAEATTLADNAFDALGSQKSTVKCVDLRDTGIKGVTVSRSTGAFAGFSSDAFIYLPAGNTAAAGEKNVVIGGICREMQIGESAGTFSIPADFTAQQAELDRTFTNGQTSTVFLPFGLPKSVASTLGKFYTFAGINASGEAELTAVTTDLAANTPYIFIPASSTVSASNVAVKALGATSATSGSLIGTYEPLSWATEQADIYGYAAETKGDVEAGAFVRVGAGASIAPFRAYLQVSGAPARINVKWPAESATTAIRTVGTSSAEKQGGWYTVGGVKLQQQPTRKGLYIHNGKTIVIQ